MRKLARAGRRDPAVRDFANQLTSELPGKSWIREIGALFDYTQKQIRYALDPNSVETLQAPTVTLELKYGDCDDKCILLASMLESIGHPSRFVALGFDQAWCFSHVIVETSGAGETPMISLDATEDYPMGWYPPGVTFRMVADV